MGTSDLHANIFPYDYYRDRPDDTVGLARTAGLVAKRARRGAQFDPARQWRHHPGHAARRLRGARQGPEDRRHPSDDRRDEQLGYAACALGNHEFNYGLEFLETAMAGANFPAVCCNIFKPDGSFYIPPWLVLEPPSATRPAKNRSFASE